MANKLLSGGEKADGIEGKKKAKGRKVKEEKCLLVLSLFLSVFPVKRKEDSRKLSREIIIIIIIIIIYIHTYIHTFYLFIIFIKRVKSR